ncbi:MAG: exodeoxyribonuclease VII small subunit [Rhodospirillaceae bacterium]|jgi:exodeoxyribonuclease VII small subunit|nr:exodeoxyribonuclease VII small subunit [Rhodospirillaceae bacterium]MBT6403516.1 exodeoxyribonuclease VII small subunit [Rhodospirillaceae bacterium]MBT6536292.1 exodeoxyribonuclease VII small subunit [Rhodospirillaceae bacterium]MBT7361399.1 exodeoxyribonuclease VII small subunit [Rhodospirillaceae bacterium]
MAKDETKVEIPADIAKMSFEDALAQLEEIVRNLEGGDSALDDAIAAYERGAALKRHCESKLRQAQARVEKISLGADGTPDTEPVPSD